ncbi:MAG: CopG family transcriptional regulator [Acidobacteria bacterium]|nr:MAG: CopG family transcriptional regulator [Acidobacteriota bacterium]
MRTTLDIDEDVLRAAKEIAAMQGTSTGRALSELARRALRSSDSSPTIRNGVPLLPERPGERLVSMELVNRMRDQE